jgi:hypothetical protein
MHEPQAWQQVLHTPRMYADLIKRGQAVEVGTEAQAGIERRAQIADRRSQIAVDTEIYDRYVSWDS